MNDVICKTKSFYALHSVHMPSSCLAMRVGLQCSAVHCSATCTPQSAFLTNHIHNVSVYFIRERLKGRYFASNYFRTFSFATFARSFSAVPYKSANCIRMQLGVLFVHLYAQRSTYIQLDERRRFNGSMRVFLEFRKSGRKFRAFYCH